MGGRTSFGEEGAEAMVGGSRFALLGQVTIGLYERRRQYYYIYTSHRRGHANIPECRAQGSRAVREDLGQQAAQGDDVSTRGHDPQRSA